MSETTVNQVTGATRGLPFRSGSSRLEGFSDAVFGFALTLLVVSLETPATFEELLELMRGVPAFAVCFYLLVMIWAFHRHFFSHYPLKDALTLVLNSVLLFVVLLYVYPLRFVFHALLTTGVRATATNARGEVVRVLELSDLPTLMVFYSGAFVAVFAVFALLYWNAWRQRDPLGLNHEEALEARLHYLGHLVNVAIGLLAVAIAGLGGPIGAAASGWLYFLLIPAHIVHGRYCDRRRRELTGS